MQFLMMIGFMLTVGRECIRYCRQRFALALGVLGLCSIIPLWGAGAPHRDAFVQDMQQLELSPGYEISLFAAEPDALNPIAISVDEQGRVYLAETDRYRDAVFDVVTQKPEWLPEDLSFRSVEDRTRFLKRTFKDNLAPLTRGSERIRLLMDVNGDGISDSSRVLADGFSTIPTGPAAGILAYRGKVWFQCLPGLWRLDWDPSSGQRISLRQLHEGFGVHVGVSGHDLHGITWGPEGRLYFSMGDRGLRVETEDGVLDYPDTGAVLRCEPDGSNLEVVAYGLRNPQEIVFDPHGNLFAGDNDTSGADQSRILHILPHADYGWRCSYQHMTGFGPWVQENFWRGDFDDVLPSAGYVTQGPSGFALHPEAGARNDVPGPFFNCDFPGGIRSFQLLPSDGTFVASDNQKWLWNLWATDLAFGPDGSMYVSDWVAGWQQPEKGRVYRIKGDVEHAGILGADVRPLLQSIARETIPERLGAWLSHDNLWVRREAQFRLVDLGEVSSRVFVRTLSSDSSILSRLHAVWGLSQLTRASGISDKPYYQAAAKVGLKDKAAEVRRATLDWLSDVPTIELLELLVVAMSDSELSVVQQATITLGEWMPYMADSEFLEDENFIDAIIAGLRQLPLKGAAHTRHGYHYLLSQWMLHAHPEDKVLNRLRHHEDVSVRMAMLQAVRRTGSKSIALFLEDAHPDVRLSAVRAIYDGRIDDALPLLVDWTPRQDTDPGAYRRWIWTHFYLGEPRHQEKLIELLDVLPRSLDRTLPVLPSEARRISFEALSRWDEGTELDPVTGLWRPFHPGVTESLGTKLENKWAGIFEHETSETLLPIIRWIAEKKAMSASHQIENLARQAGASSELRAASIRALFQLLPNRRNEWLRLGLGSGVDDIRSIAVSELDQEDGDTLLPLLVKWFENEESVSLRQSIVVAVARLEHADAEQLFESWWRSFLEGGFPAELQLELLEAVRSSARPVRLEWWKEYRDRVTEPVSRHIPEELLSGGDVLKGKTIFRDRAEVACMRCHASEGEGGVVGPVLDRISERLTPHQILESILYPNESITPGYASERFLLKDGEEMAGIVLEDADQTVRFRQADGKEMTVTKSEIERRMSSLSPMPEGVAAALKPHELRDLMAYLLSL